MGDLLPATVAEMAARASRRDFDRWAVQAEGCGYCTHPIRLRGSTRTHTSDGRLVAAYSTHAEPDGVAYVRCGNRRAAVCGSCSHEYQGDMWHLLYAGVAPGVSMAGFRDITSGNNGAYTAGPGWDACSGLGSPDGTALLNRLQG